MKTKNRIGVISSVLIGLALLFAESCTKDDVAIAPTVTTSTISDITTVAAKSGGTVTADGGATVTSRGVCWNLNGSPTTADTKTVDGVGTGSYISSLTGLTPNTAYFVRAYAINSAGTAYGSAQTFTTAPLPLPELTTATVSDITLNSASGGGTITTDGGLPVTARGVCWSTAPTPTISDSKTSDGTGTGSFVSNLTGIAPGTTYNVRAYATTTAGTGYGNVVSFTTLKLPSVTTTLVSAIAVTTASGGGNVTSEGSTSVTARGLCWSVNVSPTISDSHTSDGTGSGSFISNLTALNTNTTYHVRAYAVNSLGTAYGDEVTFATFGLEDVDGNKYYSVIIGTQEWMKTNLTTRKYRDGSDIPNVTDGVAWTGLSTGAYAEFDNNANNVATYGRLYNWYAVADARQLCPTGWHAPSDADWNTLADFLGGEDVAGGKLKATGTLQAGNGLWNSPNTDATNSSNFTALPGGHRGDNGDFTDLHNYGHWWSSEGDANNAYFRRMQDSHGKIERFGNGSKVGKSVRCVKD